MHSQPTNARIGSGCARLHYTRRDYTSNYSLGFRAGTWKFPGCASQSQEKVSTGVDPSFCSCCDASLIETMRYPQPPVLYISLSVVARNSLLSSVNRFHLEHFLFCRYNDSCSNWYEICRKRPVHSASNTLRPLQKKKKKSAFRKVVNLRLRFVIFTGQSSVLQRESCIPTQKISGRRIRYSQTPHPLQW